MIDKILFHARYSWQMHLFSQTKESRSILTKTESTEEKKETKFLKMKMKMKWIWTLA